MLAVIVANSAIQWLNPLIYNRLIYSYSESLRERVMMKIHALPLSYLDRQGTGDMVSRVTTDSDQLNNGLLMVFNQFFVGDDPFVCPCRSLHCQKKLSTLSTSDQVARDADPAD